MASTKLFLDLRGKAKDGKGSIVISLCHNNSNAKFSTGYRILKDNWDGKQVINQLDSNVVNLNLIELKNKLDKEITLMSFDSDFQGMTASEIKSAIEQKTQPEKRPKDSVSVIFNEYLEQNLSDGTKTLYKATLDKVLRFAGKDISISEINHKWLLGFEKFLSATRGVNGRAIDLRNLRAICNYAVNTNVITDYAFKNYSVKQEATKKRSVSVEELREFYYFPCRPSQVKYRDYFFLMFFLIGVNAKDLLLAKPDAISRGRFEYTRSKTRKNYSIKIEPEAKELLDKYKGENYLVEAMDHCKDYHNFLHEMNDALGMIGPEVTEEILSDDLFSEPTQHTKIEPIIPDITTYFSRHTWATLAYEIGIPFEVISQALGHSIGNKTTMIYVKQDPKKVDDANRKVIDYFFGK